MATTLDETLSPAAPSPLGRRFRNWGAIGFWGQLIPLIIGFVLAGYVIGVGGQSHAQRYLPLGNFMSFAFFLLPIFTTFWCRHYIILGRRLETDTQPPSGKTLGRAAWIGVTAGMIGAVLSLLFLFGAVFNVLYVLLSTPQVGIVLAPAGGSDAPLSVSAIDAVSLLSLLITLASELLMIWLSLWLVFAVRSSHTASPATA